MLLCCVSAGVVFPLAQNMFELLQLQEARAVVIPGVKQQVGTLSLGLQDSLSLGLISVL